MEEKEELVSMEEVKVDIVEEEASLGSPKMERFDLEKKRAVRCNVHNEMFHHKNMFLIKQN